MTELNWNLPGQRTYEVGVDRGVFYPSNGPGVAWNGMTNVTVSPSTSSPSAYYLDGVKHVQVAGRDEFKASLEAYTYPSEFEPYDGVENLGNGLSITGQRRKQFGFSYRTKIGNDIQGDDYAYKIHMVYNALATPSDRDYATSSDTLSPTMMSWEITTVPIFVPGLAHSAHLVADSRKVPTEALVYLEEILYGTQISMPRLPAIHELVQIFSTFMDFTIVDSGNGQYVASGTLIEPADIDGTFVLDHERVVVGPDGTFTTL